jgi:RHS repeat-associated protein
VRNAVAHQYTYDAEDRLVRVSSPTAEVTFRYDPLGRRSEKRVSQWQPDAPDPEAERSPYTLRYLYDQEDILATFDDAGRPVARYTHGPGIDEPLAELRGPTVRFYHADTLGTVIALSGKTEHPIRHYDYTAFGDPQDHRGTPQPYRFTGREWDKEAGLYYYRGRYYDPVRGRFLSEDLLDVRESAHPYDYAKSNPIRLRL